ncbi:sigma-70 family RNA polymerase sigma factor [Streptomyces sp. MST-110588]|uniref:RNA polymerase sigma factor n=1 Tax=Streptomyces sp. MST-110588 TaxID=2833628 RepID=UPI001F5C7F1C|nr:sigma-70 family RNA polymerase sigma factor [Streptomyces sp. MST-110588]UNO38681.1 sigma-70 family RNA polymerase sigma factor [Streptomyces sp. MST-110588]
MAAREARPEDVPQESDAGSTEDRFEIQARLLAADEQAFRTVYEQYAPLVRAVAARVTRDHCAVEDVVQVVFSQLWERPLSFDPARGSLRTWCAVAAHHRAVDWLRRERKHRKPSPPDDGPAHRDETADTVIGGLLTLRVRSAVAQLPDTLRVPLLLAYYGGRTYRQVATELGIPEGTAKSRLRTALRALAKELAEEGVEP